MGEILLSVNLSHLEDSLLWTGSNAKFRSNDLYKLMDQGKMINGPWQVIWNIRVPMRVKVFLWTLGAEILPVKKFLARRITGIDIMCPLGNMLEETVLHRFWSCPQSMVIRKEILRWWNYDENWILDENNFLISILNRNISHSHKSLWQIVAVGVLWSIWGSRNDSLFQGKVLVLEMVLFMIKEETLLWCSNNNYVSLKDSNVWSIDPVTAVDNFYKTKRKSFMEKLEKDFDFVAFSDGAWQHREENTPKGGIGGLIFSKSLSVIYMFSGPTCKLNAFETELEACSHLCYILGETKKNF